MAEFVLAFSFSIFGTSTVKYLTPITLNIFTDSITPTLCIQSPLAEAASSPYHPQMLFSIHLGSDKPQQTTSSTFPHDSCVFKLMSLYLAPWCSSFLLQSWRGNLTSVYLYLDFVWYGRCLWWGKLGLTFMWMKSCLSSECVGSWQVHGRWSWGCRA